MITECSTCELRNTCNYLKKYPDTVMCTDFGGVDINGNLVEDEENENE